MDRRPKSSNVWYRLLVSTLASMAASSPNWAADTDIYAGSTSGGAPNVLFFLDNTSNWSAQNNAWTPGSSWDKCKNLDVEAVTKCKAAIEEVFYVDKPANAKRPWENGFNDWNSNQSPTQGQVELRALRLVLKDLVCSGNSDPLNVNVGLSMFSPNKGSALSSGDPVAFIYHAVQKLEGTASTGSCKALLDKLNVIDANINSPSTKAPSDANYGAALYEAFKYFGGFTNPNQVTTAGTSTAGSPVSDRAYGTQRFSLPMPLPPAGLDDPDAYTDAARTLYKSPIGASSACGNNYLILIGNSYPNEEGSNSGPPRFQPGASYLGYTPPSLSPVTSDTSRYADEWTYFLANTDINSVGGIQRLYTYAVNVFNAAKDPSQTRVLKSMAATGGVGSSGYVEVGGDLLSLVAAIKSILTEVAAVNSVFTAATLPVSTTTQGAYLNQIFLGMFRPDANAGPRWIGNLKQYKLGFVNGTLDLLDAKGSPAVLSGVGFLSPLAESFWTESSVFFSQAPSGTPPSASDLPDGSLIDKGGVAQILRRNNLQNATSRTVYTLPAGATSGPTPLSSTPFSSSNSDVTSTFSTAEIAWVRGENNVASGSGVEDFVGSYMNSSTLTALGPTGARHSIHGDVLHSRPYALNYGNGEVVVFYGSNDGFLRAVDGRTSGSTSGHELWSFVAPEHYNMIKRLRLGTPLLHLPETDDAGSTLTPASETTVKDYGMDGPIGVYARYQNDASSITEAMIFPAMRRGGRNVYAFGVTTKTNPVFLWKIAGGTGDYGKLAQTWSMPKPVILKSDLAQPPILLFMGGGYDPAEDSNSVSSPRIGNVIYVINGRTGTRIAEIATDYSVPSDVTVVDVDGNGDPDRAYVADVRGNLYRIDIPQRQSSDPADHLLLTSTWSGVVAQKIAELGGKVFFPPDVVVTKLFVAVLVGTGDREKPLLVSTTDNFFLIKDNLGTARATALTKDDLTRVARTDNATMQPADVNNSVNDNEGCYLEMATNGEKVVNAPFTIAGVTYFGTNRPAPAAANSCSSGLGEAYAYQFPLFCKAPTLAKLVDGGLPPSPVGGIVELTVDGQLVKVPFILGSGTGGSSFRPSQPNPPVPPVRTRLNWRIDNTNR